MKKVLIYGAGGFIGGHLEHRLKAEGHYVVSASRHQPLYRESVADSFHTTDLAHAPDFHYHFMRQSFDEIYQLAGSVGDLGFIGDSDNDASILSNSLKINLHTLEAMRSSGACGKVFFASSQCVYPDIIENGEHSAPTETDASFNTFAFGQEKLFAEKLYDAYHRNHGIRIAIGRLGNTYGPYGTWQGSRAKAPAALCRKIAEARHGQDIEIWGDGKATRSFTYVDDAVEGILRLMATDYAKPVNIASAEAISIDDLAKTICAIATKPAYLKHVNGATGVRHRGSDNTLCREVLGWEPSTPLIAGLSTTYHWVMEQVDKAKVTV